MCRGLSTPETDCFLFYYFHNIFVVHLKVSNGGRSTSLLLLLLLMLSLRTILTWIDRIPYESVAPVNWRRKNSSFERRFIAKYIHRLKIYGHDDDKANNTRTRTTVLISIVITAVFTGITNDFAIFTYLYNTYILVYYIDLIYAAFRSAMRDVVVDEHIV